MGFKDDLKNLRTSVFGSGVVNIDDAIEDVTREIVNKRRLQTTTVIELMKRIEDYHEQKGETTPDLVSMIKGDIKRQSFTIEGDRSARYSQVDYVYDFNPQIAQALRVYLSNVLSPDFFTKQAMDITCTMPEFENTADYKQIRNQVEAIIEHTKLEEEVTDIVTFVLKYGDCFVEVYNPKEELIELGVLREQVESMYDPDNVLHTTEQPAQTRSTTPLPVLENYSINLRVPKVWAQQNNMDLILLEAEAADEGSQQGKDISVTPTDEDTKDQIKRTQDDYEAKKKKVGMPLEEIKIKVHNPNNVIIIKEGDVLIGYLLLENQAARLAGRAGGSTGDVTERIVQGILTSVGDAINAPSIVNDPEALNIIYNLVKRNKLKYNELNVRFLPPTATTQFKLLPSKFSPYGESVFYPVLYTARLMTALRTSLVIYRLSRAPEKRVFNIETGLSRDASALIEEVKAEMNRREITIDKLGTIDSMSSILSTFESIYLPMVNGKKFVEMETQAGGQLTDKVEDINLILKELLSGIGIPPALLGYEQDIESRATLAQQNVKFARQIIQIQKDISHSLTKLILGIYVMVNPKTYNQAKASMRLTLKPPRTLMLEKIAELVDQVDKLVETLGKWDYPVEKIVTYFLGDIIDPTTMQMAGIEKRMREKILGTKEGGEEGEGGEGWGGK